MKENLAATGERLRRHKESNARRIQNGQFATAERNFYRTQNPDPGAKNDILVRHVGQPSAAQNIKIADVKKTTTNLKNMATRKFSR